MKYILLFIVPFHMLLGQTDTTLKLWYQKPAGSKWENALPVGNGRLGAMIYGNVDQETIQLNEHTVWSGGPNRNDNPDARIHLAQIRKWIFEGKYKQADSLAKAAIITKKSHGQMFQPVGNLRLLFPDHKEFSDYKRELNIENAVATTTYTNQGVEYTRETFASLAHRVLVIRLVGSKKASLSFQAYFTSQHQPRQITAQADELMLHGVTSDQDKIKGQIKFQAYAKIVLDGGSMQQTDTSLIITNSNAATILITIATNFNKYDDITGDEITRAQMTLHAVHQKKYELLKKDHIAVYRHYFDRVKLDLGPSKQPNLPTDERLALFTKTNDPYLVKLYYQFGRYLLISSSQPGGQPANLQGIWNHRMNPPWDSKYTININAQMNYWPAEKTNLAELHRPFLELIRDLSITGQETAQKMYHTGGWVAHHNTDIWRITGAIDGPLWGVWPTAGGWLIQHLWEHYLYAGDKKYLSSVYPAMKGATVFLKDFLIEHPVYKWLVISPSSSPENSAQGHEGTSIDAGVTMDNQIVLDAFNATIEAATALGIDHDFIDSLKLIRDKLPPMQIGQHSQLQEWLDDLDDPADHHRHISHLYGLYPSNQISAWRTPELFRASRNTLTQRGDVSTGWSMGWKVNWWAQLLDGNHAYKLIQNQLTPVGDERGSGGTYNNLLDAHPPFQIDGNFGCTSGITEMLVQSDDGAIHLLPALPDVWPNGKLSGVRTRGGFEIKHMEWKNHKLEKLVIISKLGGNLRLRVTNELTAVKGPLSKTAMGENPNPFFVTPTIPKPVISVKANIHLEPVKPTVLLDWPTAKGKTYTFVAKK